MTASMTLGSRKGTRASRPCAMVMRSARWQVTLCRGWKMRRSSLWIAALSGASRKYRYPAKSSSLPSPVSTTLTCCDARRARK